MRETGQKGPYLDFLRELVTEMLSLHGKLPSTPAQKKRPSLNSTDPRL
jgi:hypothetical protein